MENRQPRNSFLKTQKMAPMTIVALLLLISIAQSSALTSDEDSIVMSFPKSPSITSKSARLQHLTADESGKNLYVGATNALYQLDASDLQLRHHVVTGPRRDSPYCNWNGRDCIRTLAVDPPPPPVRSESVSSRESRTLGGSSNDTKVTMDNVNQLLLPFADRGVLIACGTLHQGVCSLHRMENISRLVHVDGAETVPVAANSANASTVAFVSSGPDGEPTLFVAATFTYEHYREAFPAVCSRTLNAERMFDLSDPGDVSTQSALTIRAEYRADFRVDYVGGFSWNGFAYWAAVQRPSVADRHEAPLVSKLVRVCERDKKYRSYSELPLQCLGSDNTDYNRLRAVHVGRLGERARTRVGAAFLEQQPERTEFLIGVFGRESAEDEKQPGGPGGKHRSAVCVYPMKEINAAFRYNIQRCQNGVDYWNLPHFGLNLKCRNISIYVLSDECQLGRVGGTIPSSRMAAITYHDTQLTAVTARIVDGRHTVLYLGTSDGRIKKVSLASTTEATEFGELQVSSARRAISKDLLLSPDQNFLYVLAETQLLKVKTSNCAAHRTCATCVQAGDAHCGWCTLQRACTPRVGCRHADVDFGYIATDDGAGGVGAADGRCPRLVAGGAPEPRNASVFAASADVDVRLTLVSLPPLIGEGRYQCVYGDVDGGVFVSAVFQPPRTVVCALPAYADRPRVTGDRDHISIPLRLWSSETGVAFHEEEFIFYDCNSNQLCTSCVGSKWRCEWCLMDNRCVHDRQLCSNQTSTNGDSQCPHINRSAMPNNRILLPSGKSSEIRLPVVNLESITGQTSGGGVLDGGLECALRVDDREMRTAAEWSDDGWVTCRPFAYHYDGDLPTMDAELFLTAGASYVIDKTAVRLYKCDQLSSDCSRCVTLDPVYECRWCGGECRYGEFCPLVSGLRDDRPTSCPGPVIDSIWPTSGPTEGGTRVIIKGSELGSRREDIERRVLVAGVPCHVVDYEISIRIECITTATVDYYSGPVKVVVGSDGKRTGLSEERFQYVQLSVTSITPPLGPQSGGTRLTISGQNLDSGSTRAVWLGTIQCTVLEEDLTENELVCMTSSAPVADLSLDSIVVKVDSANATIRSRYTYVADPRVTSIAPMAAFQSGGRLLTIRGTNLNSVAHPQIYLVDPTKLRQLSTYDDPEPTTESLLPLASAFGECRAENATLLWCESPKLLSTVRQKRATLYGQNDDNLDAELTLYPEWLVGFKMDGVKELTLLDPSFQFRIVPDPVFTPFQNGRKLYRGQDGDEPLIIEGARLSVASSPSDVQVFIGRERCNVTLIVARQLMCQPPVVQPSGIDYDGRRLQDGRPMVTVLVGNMHHELGVLAYESAGGVAYVEAVDGGVWSSFLTPTLVGAITVGMAVVLLVMLVYVAVWWRRKSWQAEKEYKRIQLQMDNLESNVRHECKQAFAELQTDISVLTSDLVPLGIPYNARRVYAAKFLFKDDQQHAFLLDWSADRQLLNGNGYSSHLHVALAQFEALLWNRHFVVQLVNALESQRGFSAQDRVYVASLLTACLARNMQYYTDVVMTLLRQLIARAVDTKCPHLMLRRTESVVEKMLANWIALCLFDYLQERPGAKLFLMYKALKHQIDKGPVDAVTGEARYSISEDRLLKEQVTFVPLVLRVIPPREFPLTSSETPDVASHATSSPVLCRVLSCDTISQAKNKVLDALYRSTPSVARPSISDVDLEWRCPSRGAVVLMDDDRQSPSPKDGWRRLATVDSYAVPNNALVAVVPRCRSSFTYTSGSSQTYCSITSSTQLISNGGSGGHHSPSCDTNHESTHDGCRGGVNYWHLVPLAPNGGGGGSSVPHQHTSTPSSTLPPTILMTLGRRRTGGGTSDKLCSSHSLYGDAGVGLGTSGTLHHQQAAPTKSIPEIYLTRLLTSKGTVQKFIDDFFTSSFHAGSAETVDGETPTAFPPVIKYLFDFFEREAEFHQLQDLSVPHSWKNNSLPLRFWVNVIKNPDFVFDCEKSPTVDSCLSVVAQAFMDACSSSETRLGKDSPSNKLLFAKDIPRYREMVNSFYRNIRQMPPVTDQDLSGYMAQLSKSYAQEFNVVASVREVLSYVVKYNGPILASLTADPTAQRQRLAERLEQVLMIMNGQATLASHTEHIYQVVT